MIRLFVLLLLQLIPLALTGCSGGNSSTPPDNAPNAPHPLNGTYLDGANHGPDAKTDLTACQACHGQPGGPGSNPRFNIGIDSVNGTGCEACHGINYAHPVDWAGPNNTYHYSASNIQKACTLCHGVNLGGIAEGGVGISCLGCHDSTINFTLDCNFCHGYPPATDIGVAHANVAGGYHDICVVCHGMKESASGGSFSVAADYLLFNKDNESIGDHWNGLIDMNASPGYNEANWGCDLACHVNDINHQLSDSGLPVELKSFGYGESVPHPVDSSFLLAENHGPAAKGLTAAFPNGMVDCQPCHAQAGVNPRFNIPIIRFGWSCETCHNDQVSHPSVGARDTTPWYDDIYKHSDVTDFTTICTLCHGATLGGVADGGIGPACIVCHTIDPVANPNGCVSCHNLPPAGNVRPNLQGQHSRVGHSSLINNDPSQTCGRCHNGVGIGTAAHFDTSSPADVVFFHPDRADTISSISTVDNTTCNGACHINSITVTHDNSTWYPTQ